MKKHYFLIEGIKDWPHAGVHIDKITGGTYSVENIIGHFDEFSYTNIYNVNRYHLLEKDSYKFLINFIHMPATTEFHISKESVDILNNDKNAYLVLFSCFENIITPEELSDTIKNYGILHDKVIVMCSYLPAHNQVINGINYSCINFWESYSRYHHKTLTDIAVRNSSTLRREIQKAEQKFLCLNRNVKPHRIWFYYAMIKSKIVNQGYVSYHLPKIHPADYKLVSEGPWVLKRIPAELHKDFKLTNARKMYPKMLDKINTNQIINYNDSILPYYTNTLFSIVTESDARNNFITEKTYKAIVNLHPFFIIGNPDQHTILRARGYHTFEDFFGISSVTDYNEAMQLCFNIDKMDLNETKRTIKNEYYDKLIHNRNNFFNRKVTWNSIVKEMFNAIEKK